MSKVNYILDYSDLKVRIIDQIILKVKNVSKYKYDQQYGYSN